MNNDSVKTFRNQINGFNKDDVNQYILEIDRKHTEERGALQRELEECQMNAVQLSQANDELNAAILAHESEIQELKASLASAQEQLAAAQAETDEKAVELKNAIQELNAARETFRMQKMVLTAEKTELSDALAEEKEKNRNLNESSEVWEEKLRQKDEESRKALTAMETAKEQEKSMLAARKEEEKSELEKRISALMKEQQEREERAQIDNDPNVPGTDAYKLRMYDRISSQLGDILINANRSADEILAAARADAEKMRIETDNECEQKRRECEASVSRTREETEEEAAYIRERLSVTANELLSNASADLHGSMENCIREINASIMDMQYEIRSLMSKMASRTDEMNDRISYYQSCVSEGIEKKLTEMDDKYGLRHPSSEDTADD